MRIALVTQEYPPYMEGGAGRYMVELARALREAGNDVTVFGPLGTILHQKDLETTEAKQIPPGSSLVSWAALPLSFIREKREHGRYDVVHASGVSGMSLPRSVMGAPFVVTVHHVTRFVLTGGASISYRLRRFRSEAGVTPFLERIEVGRASRIVVPSFSTLDAFRDAYPRMADKVRLVYPGFSGSVGIPTRAPPSNPIIRKLASDELPYVLAVGRSEARKGLAELIAAFPSLTTPPNLQLVLAGANPKSSLIGIASDLKVVNRVHFLGRVSADELARLFDHCEVFVSPSRVEGFGYSIVEAMSHGCAVIVSGGTGPELVVSGTTGLTCDGTIAGLTHALTQLLGDEDLRHRMGQAAKAAIVGRFSPRFLGKEIAELYLSAIQHEGAES